MTTPDLLALADAGTALVDYMTDTTGAHPMPQESIPETIRKMAAALRACVEDRAKLLELLQELYNGPQDGRAVYEAAKLDTGRLLRGDERWDAARRMP